MLSDSFSVKFIPCFQRKGNKLNTKLFDRYYFQNCKVITFWKIAIIPNGNKLMFQVIFIFSDWILIEQITASSHLFCLMGNKKFYQGFWFGDWAWVKKDRFNDFLGMRKPWIEKFFPHMSEYPSQRKFNNHSREIKP